jgi:hypothetical protein
VLSSLKQSLCNEFADLATCLRRKVSSRIECKSENRVLKNDPTYPDNRNFFDVVLKALRLLAGIFLRHNPEQSKTSEIQIQLS